MAGAQADLWPSLWGVHASGPCSSAAPWSVEPASLVSAPWQPQGLEGQLSRGTPGAQDWAASLMGVCCPWAKTRAELRGCRKAEASGERQGVSQQV